MTATVSIPGSPSFSPPALPFALQAIANAAPEAVALMQAAEKITYGELHQQIAVLAHYLSTKICAGDRVAIIVDNSITWVIAAYAVWRAGGVLVALNTALQAEEHANLLQHCEASLCLLEKNNARLIAALKSQQKVPFFITCFDDELALPAERWQVILQTRDDRKKQIDNVPNRFENREAMIIYTSGTTGAPKGVVLTHQNLAANVAAIRECLALRSSDVVMCVLPFFYSFGNSVLHSHLLSGSQIVLENSLMYPHRILDRMAELGVTVFYGVPSTYYLLLARTQVRDYALTSLRLCAQAGGHMDPTRIALFRDQLPNCDFVVMYGQTEASARISCLPPTMQEKKAGSVGIAIPGVTISIRNEEGEECKPGEQGEVCIQGPNVMQGYLKAEEQTASVLRAGYLHTGDLGYLDEEGYLYLIGRNSEMIKTGAHRVSPLEIEELVAQIEDVAEVAVTAVDDQILGSAIACYIVKARADKDDAELRMRIMRLCKEHLPAYKMPKVIHYVDTLPKTVSGKVIKRLLTAREHS